jgi:Ca2+-binding RTX toxin-like protein
LKPSPRRRPLARPATITAATALALAGATLALGAVVTGTGGDDRLKGTARADLIRGLAGDDQMVGLAGNDRIDAGAGADRALGGPGNDRMIGGPGDDGLDGGPGNDQLDGGPGDDQLFGAAGNDVIVAGAGIDAMTGGTGDDRVSAGAGEDLVQGAAGADVLDGGPANDIVDAYDRPARSDTVRCGPGTEDMVLADTLDVPSRDCEAFDRSDDPKRIVLLGFAGERWRLNSLTFPAGWVKPGETFTCGPGGGQRTALYAFAMFRGMEQDDLVLVTWRVDGDVFNSSSTRLSTAGTGVETFVTRYQDPDKPLPDGLWEVELAVDAKVQSKVRFRRACGG